MAQIPEARSTRAVPWLHGPGVDLLLGAGVAYLISVPLILLLPSADDASSWPVGVVWIIAIGLNGSHYGATLLRVYGERAQRRKYAFFSIWLTLLLAGLFVAGAYDAWVGSFLVTLYVTWSPWHFAGQNYGIALMFLRRADVPVEARAKRLLYASFVLSFLLAFFALHVEGATNVYAPTRSSAGPLLDLLRLGIPRAVALPVTIVTGLAYLGCLAGAFGLLARHASLRELAPVAAVVLCQALWFAVPALHDMGGTGVSRGLAFAAIWISAAHSIQYLWVTLYYEKRAGHVARTTTYLAKALLAGNAAFVIPGILFAPQLLGSRSWDAGLGLLIFSVVNIHHFFLDGAIWKLRDGAVARALLRAPDPGDAARAAPSQTRLSVWSRVLWAMLALCFMVEVGELVQKQAEKAGSSALAGAALDVLALAGRDHEGVRIRLGRAALRRHDFADAHHQFQRSVASRPTVAGYAGMGRALEGQGDWSGAITAYEAGLEIRPGDAELLRSAGRVWLELGESRRAEAMLVRSLEIESGHPETREMLDRSRRERTD